MIKSMVVGFCFIGVLVMGVRSFRELKCLRCYFKTLWMGI